MNNSIFSSVLFRKAALSVCYVLGLSISLLVSWQLRFDFAVPESIYDAIFVSAVWIIPLKLLALAYAGQFSGLLTFFGVRDLVRLFGAIAGSSLLILIIRYVLPNPNLFVPPRGIILADFVFSFMGLASIRLAVRLNGERLATIVSSNKIKKVKIAIVGAGYSGAALAKDLFARSGMGMEPVCFFDDDTSKIKSNLHGIPIVGSPERILDSDFYFQIDKLIIALPTSSGRRIKEVINIGNQIGIDCEIVPSIEELTSGRVKVSKLRKVQIQDLLKRETIELQTLNIKRLIEDKVVMITGAGGSIGSELCRQVANYSSRRVLLVEQCEVQIFSIQQELNELGFGDIILPIVADILDTDRMEYIFRRYKPNIIFHAAAHKHVFLMEQQPAEAFCNNTKGTINMANLAARFGAEQFILVSTDKAINPTSVMGATKRLAEIYVQSLNADQEILTTYIAVRFGNVLGSSGSVVPIFEKQIEEGGPVTVTHPDVVRFFMTISEAVGLILQASSQADGGEIFVLDMGQPVKILDLANQLIELHGHKPGEDVEIEFTGLKPGEKLYEEISHKGENLEKTNHTKILSFVSKPDSLSKVNNQIQEINKEIHYLEADQIKIKFKEAIPEYNPFLN